MERRLNAAVLRPVLGDQTTTARLSVLARTGGLQQTLVLRLVLGGDKVAEAGLGLDEAKVYIVPELLPALKPLAEQSANCKIQVAVAVRERDVGTSEAGDVPSSIVAVVEFVCCWWCEGKGRATQAPETCGVWRPTRRAGRCRDGDA